MTTNKIMALAEAYADAANHRWGHQRCALENAIERIIAERDTLATAVRHCHCNLPPDWDGDCLKDALDVCRRLTAASKANPPAEPAEISPLAEKLATMRVMVAAQRDSNGNGFTGSDDAIAAVAAVVEALAKEDKR